MTLSIDDLPDPIVNGVNEPNILFSTCIFYGLTIRTGDKYVSTRVKAHGAIVNESPLGRRHNSDFVERNDRLAIL
jgi:hypothetical protein